MVSKDMTPLLVISTVIGRDKDAKISFSVLFL